MGLFSNPLSYAGYPQAQNQPSKPGQAEVQNATVRAATAAEVIAGVIDYAYVSPLTLTGSGSELGPRTLHGVLIGEGTAAPLGATAAGANGTLLQGKGASADPAFTTATYPSTTTINQLLYSSATNTVTGLATANSALLNTSAGGAPSLATSPTISGTFTAGTGLATTAGNLALNGVASHVLINASAPTTAAVGFVTLSGSATTTLTSSAITANSIILFSLKTLGTLSASAITYTTTTGSATITPAGSTDTSVYGYLIIN